jgi:hypothetical protein
MYPPFSLEIIYELWIFSIHFGNVRLKFLKLQVYWYFFYLYCGPEQPYIEWKELWFLCGYVYNGWI